MLPHFDPKFPLNNYNDGPVNHMYCSYCLSDKLRVYEGKGKWEELIYQDDKLECLDCGWKGQSKDCKLMSKKVHDKIFLGLTRRNKILKLRNK